MRVLILTPTALPSVSGNATTAERWRRALLGQGATARILATEGSLAGALAAELRAERPDVIHVHHPYRAGSLLLDPEVEKLSRDLPLVVSPGGTDVHLDVEVRERWQIVLEVISRAAAIIVQGEALEARLREVLRDSLGRIVRVPKAFIWLGDDAFDLRRTAGCREGDVLFLLPAGIRPVKGNLECARLLRRVNILRGAARGVFAGPALDSEYAARFEDEIASAGGSSCWVSTIPPPAMRAAYAQADVVLNCSRSEGSPNALMEAAAAGRPVLARDIPANREFVAGGGSSEPCGRRGRRRSRACWRPCTDGSTPFAPTPDTTGYSPRCSLSADRSCPTPSSWSSTTPTMSRPPPGSPK
jgi:glycosyltransferase involved in cell wall biosynthesis